jgi:hypothetical protein
LLLKPGAGAGGLPTKPEVSFGISNVFKDGDLADLAEVSMNEMDMPWTKLAGAYQQSHDLSQSQYRIHLLFSSFENAIPLVEIC